MLVLSRRSNESIVINGNITVTVLEIRGDHVRIGIDAPREITVHREEIHAEYAPVVARAKAETLSKLLEMLAEAEDIEPDLIGEHDLLDEVAEPFRRAGPPSGDGIGSDVCEGIETDFHDCLPGAASQLAIGVRGVQYREAALTVSDLATRGRARRRYDPEGLSHHSIVPGPRGVIPPSPPACE